MICDTTSVYYPLLADIYYPVIDKSAYGSVVKSWTHDATVACNFAPAGSKSKTEVQPNTAIQIDSSLIGRTRRDIRYSTTEVKNSVTNVLITNVRDRFDNQIYMETSGPRAGLPTVFEIATNDPIVGPFGKVEYFRVLIRRSENQAVEI